MMPLDMHVNQKQSPDTQAKQNYIIHLLTWLTLKVVPALEFLIHGLEVKNILIFRKINTTYLFEKLILQ